MMRWIAVVMFSAVIACTATEVAPTSCVSLECMNAQATAWAGASTALEATANAESRARAEINLATRAPEQTATAQAKATVTAAPEATATAQAKARAREWATSRAEVLATATPTGTAIAATSTPTVIATATPTPEGIRQTFEVVEYYILDQQNRTLARYALWNDTVPVYRYLGPSDVFTSYWNPIGLSIDNENIYVLWWNYNDRIAQVARYSSWEDDTPNRLLLRGLGGKYTDIAVENGIVYLLYSTVPQRHVYQYNMWPDESNNGGDAPEPSHYKELPLAAWSGIDVVDDKIYLVNEYDNYIYRYPSITALNYSTHFISQPSKNPGWLGVSVTSKGFTVIGTPKGRQLIRYRHWGDDTGEPKDLPQHILSNSDVESIVVESLIEYPARKYEGLGASQSGEVYVLDNRRNRILWYKTWEDDTPYHKILPKPTTHGAWVGISVAGGNIYAHNDENRRTYHFDNWDDASPSVKEWPWHYASGVSSDDSGKLWLLYTTSIALSINAQLFFKPIPDGGLYTGLHVQGNSDAIYLLDNLNDQILRYTDFNIFNAHDGTLDVKALPVGEWTGIVIYAGCILILDSTSDKERIGRDCNWDATDHTTIEYKALP